MWQSNKSHTGKKLTFYLNFSPISRIMKRVCSKNVLQWDHREHLFSNDFGTSKIQVKFVQLLWNMPKDAKHNKNTPTYSEDYCSNFQFNKIIVQHKIHKCWAPTKINYHPYTFWFDFILNIKLKTSYEIWTQNINNVKQHKTWKQRETGKRIY